jgi:hypothetical protein
MGSYPLNVFRTEKVQLKVAKVLELITWKAHANSCGSANCSWSASAAGGGNSAEILLCVGADKKFCGNSIARPGTEEILRNFYCACRRQGAQAGQPF